MRSFFYEHMAFRGVFLQLQESRDGIDIDLLTWKILKIPLLWDWLRNFMIFLSIFDNDEDEKFTSLKICVQT